MGVALKLVNWQGWAGIGLTVVLSVLLAIQFGEARHWHKKSDNYEKLYTGEQSAHRQTVINYQTAAEQARKADAANKARVEAEQAANNQKRDTSYEARIADARARADRLQHGQAAAHPGGPGTAPVSNIRSPSGGPDGSPAEAGLPPSDALIATEQAIQLDELEQWVDGQVGIDTNSTPRR